MGLIAIGDIHGCASTLDALLERLSPTHDDQLVFIGDYIDRGPDSKGVIDRLLELAGTHDCVFLRGNHEALLLDWLDHGEYEAWRINGGGETLRSYANDPERAVLPEAHVAFIRETRLYYDTPDAFFVHAGLKPQLSIAENLARYGEHVYLWERSHIRADHVAWEKLVVCGHTPQAQVVLHERLIDIDTGCVYHTHPGLGLLTALRLPEIELVQVPFQG